MLWTTLLTIEGRTISNFSTCVVNVLAPDSCQGTRTSQEGLSYDTAENDWANEPIDWDRGFVECKVNHLLDSYDFVGLIERQDESLVAMKLNFLDFSTILAFSFS
jgi:hypothetical protein